MKKVILLILGILVLLIGAFALVLVPSVKKSPSTIGQETAIEKILSPIAYAMVSEFKSEADYRSFWEETAAKVSQQDVFTLEMDLSDSEGNMIFKVDGEDIFMKSEYTQEGQEMTMIIVQKGEYGYYGNEEKGFKVKEDNDEHEEMFLGWGLEDFQDAFGEWEDESLEYKGLEAINGRKFHVYYSHDEGSTVWIDALAKLPVKFQDDDGSEGFYSYKPVKIEAPEGYEDISHLSQEEQGVKIWEIFASEFDFDEDWDDEDWDLDMDFDFEEDLE
jgi:hypothetical protein